MLALQPVTLLLKTVQFISQNDGVDAGLDAVDKQPNLALHVIEALADLLHFVARVFKLPASFCRKIQLEAFERCRRQQAHFQGMQHRALDQAPVNLQAVRASCRSAVLVLGAAITVAVHDNVVGPTLRTLEQSAEQILWAGASPCLLAACRLLQLALIGNDLLPRLDFRPHVGGHNTQFRYIFDHPHRFVIGFTGALTRVRIRDEAGTVPDVAAVIQSVVQDATAILRVTMNRRACPSAAAGRRHAFFVQFRRNRHRGVPLGKHPVDSPHHLRLSFVD